MNNEEIMTVQELADFLKVSTVWVYQKKAQHKIPYRKIGSSIRFIKSEIIEWVKSNSSDN